MEKDERQDGEEVLGVVSHGDGNVTVIRHREDDSLAADTFRSVREGEALNGKKVHVLRQLEDGKVRLETLIDGSRSGPSMVNSRAYRDNWEAIWGKAKDGLPN